MILLKNFFINTTADLDVHSVVHETKRAIGEAGISEGSVLIHVPAPGAAVTIIEPLPDIVKHLKEAVRVFPGEGVDTKDRRKEEIDVGPRVMAAMVGKSIQIPVSAGKLVLAPMEEPVIIDMDKGAKRREFYVQVTGEGGGAGGAGGPGGQRQPLGRIQQ